MTSILISEKAMATHSSVLAWKTPWMGAWWAAVYGFAQSQTRLKRLISSSSSVLIYRADSDIDTQ